jgi:hypothetical protein
MGTAGPDAPSWGVRFRDVARGPAGWVMLAAARHMVGAALLCLLDRAACAGDGQPGRVRRGAAAEPRGGTGREGAARRAG